MKTIEEIITLIEQGTSQDELADDIHTLWTQVDLNALSPEEIESRNIILKELCAKVFAK